MTHTALKEILESKNLQGLALDIDETLADSNTPWFEEMYKFHAPVGLTLSDILSKYKFVEQVPEWGTEESSKYTQHLLNSDEFNESLPLIEDANHIVNKIDKIMPIVAYITARPKTVRKSTESWLKKHGFPDAPVLMRGEGVQAVESDVVGRNQWKAQVLVDLYPFVTGIIDDNILLTHELHNVNYKGTLVCLRHQYRRI